MFSCSEMRGKSKKIINEPLRSRANRVITTTDGSPSWYALIGRRSTAGGLLEAILYSSFRRELPTIGRIKKKQRLGRFQNVQRYAPWGAYLTLSFRKKCSGTPPGGVTRLHLSLNWGLTDRQVSLPPFRALLRSGGPELSKLGQHGTFGSWLLPAPSFVGSWLPPTPSFVGS